MLERKGRVHMKLEPKSDVVEKNDKGHMAPEFSHDFHYNYIF